MAITSVGQEYEFTESQHDYKTGTGTIFGGKGASMDIGKFRDNYDKEGRSRCFNCNIYKHMAKKCWKPRKDKEMRKFYKCNRIVHLAKDCRLGQKMKIRSTQEENDKENDNNEEDFVKGSE